MISTETTDVVIEHWQNPCPIITDTPDERQRRVDEYLHKLYGLKQDCTCNCN